MSFCSLDCHFGGSETQGPSLPLSKQPLNSLDEGNCMGASLLQPPEPFLCPFLLEILSPEDEQCGLGE